MIIHCVMYCSLFIVYVMYYISIACALLHHYRLLAVCPGLRVDCLFRVFGEGAVGPRMCAIEKSQTTQWIFFRIKN